MKKLFFVLFILMSAMTQNVQAQESMLAEVKIFAGNFAPSGWAFCDGQMLAISQNQALFALIGTRYGGDGRTTFALPDLRGRVAIGSGTGAGLKTVRQGESGGVESTTLNQNNIPSHNHTVTPKYLLEEAQGGGGNVATDHTGGSNYYKVTSEKVVPTTATGANQAFENRQPYLGIGYIICLQGIFPSRN